jgi:lactoylglutathione lyase
MKFAKTIVYVPDVAATVGFFEKAFGLETKLYLENGYGEINIGGAKVSVATHQVGLSHLPPGFEAAPDPSNVLQYELSLVSESVQEDFQRAVEAGAEPLQAPEVKPWGQTSSYLRAPGGVIVDLASPSPAWG